ncbi:VasL domain-containing protein [Enterobacter sp. Bisph1]|uniref:VasL domain-containing protein n=1 Tax=Enterobacter sp. Bisph1 TaxID=1274399 RepID=UPI00057C05CF|nr:VasL domain-containing protein [Enterobacter sp. Bisph1]
MNDFPSRNIKTGSDPRALADYAALREEVSKLSHPARPDISWLQVEKYCLSLFEINGVDLQTAGWYTLARTHIAAVQGMNEGLMLVSALVSYQWAVMWPQPVAQRVDILSGLNQRLQKVFRTLTLARQDLQDLYQSEKLLSALNDGLARHELKQVCQLDVLARQIQQMAARLEKSAPEDANPLPVAIPPQALAVQQPSHTVTEHRLVYVIHPEPQINQEQAIELPTVHEKRARRLPFVGAIASAFIIGALSAWGWQSLPHTDDASSALGRSLAELPVALTEDQLALIKRTGTLPETEAWLTRAAMQLDNVAELAPDWRLQYGQQIIAQAQALWPEDERVQQLQQRWQKQVAVNILPEKTLTGWHEGMTQLQTLGDRLNELDRQKGKYLTVSELKSAVFNMMTRFQQTRPTEDQLRQIRLQPAASPERQQQIRQLEQHLLAQIYALHQIKSGQENR